MTRKWTANHVPDKALCSGGSSVVLEAGLWRENRYSDEFYECDDEGKRCLGGEDGNECAEGYLGPLCLQCDAKNNFLSSPIESSRCDKCSETSNTFIVTCLILAGTFAFNLLIVYITYRENMIAYYAYLLSGKLEMAKPDSYVRLLNTYGQILIVIGSASASIYAYLDFGEYLSVPYDQIFFSVDCVFLNNGVPVDKILKLKIILYLLSPVSKLIVFFILVCALFLALSLRKSSNSRLLLKLKSQEAEPGRVYL